MAGRRVLVLIGSETDLVKVEPAVTVLSQHGIDTELRVASAHRTPERVVELAMTARDRGFGVIIAAAGLAAALPGTVAAHTTLPVVALPLAAGTLLGIDALLACVQMPPGVPVATVGIDSARNAGLLAVQILALGDPALSSRLAKGRRAMARAIEESDGRIGGGKR
ncbi:MAG: 5-(carboxyamino)imidazole ribonucleotide mutase [Deltaproteobacteria bacterium]|nr:5-(carboxyamino)imidazole ribonucleotide mutase [Deltaproteobacteria bacterium]